MGWPQEQEHEQLDFTFLSQLWVPMFLVWTRPWGDISEMYLEGGAGGSPCLAPGGPHAGGPQGRSSMNS